MAAFAADAADDAPRALMMAPPRVATVGMKVFSSQSWSFDHLGGILTIHLAVEQIGILGAAVVPPNGHVGDRRDRLTDLLTELGERPVVVEAGHRMELAGIDVGSRMHCDQGIGVGRVADDEDLDVLGSVVVDRLALRSEDAPVGLEKVGPFHPGLPGHRPDEQCVVGISERNVGVVGLDRSSQQREGAIVRVPSRHRRAHRGPG